MEISFCSHPNTNKVITTIFGTWHDSWAVVACAKFWCDMVISNWIRAKWNFHRIWIVMEKSLVKRAPDHDTGTEIRYQDPCTLPWSKMATATTGKDVYTAIFTLSHCVSRVWRWVLGDRQLLLLCDTRICDRIWQNCSKLMYKKYQRSW